MWTEGHGISGQAAAGDAPHAPADCRGKQSAGRGLLAKILQKLPRHGLFQSFRGRQRGHSSAPETSEIKLRKLLEAPQGPDLLQRRIFWGARRGNDNPCPLYSGWGMVKPHFVELIQQRTLDGLAQGRALRKPIQRQRR